MKRIETLEILIGVQWERHTMNPKTQTEEANRLMMFSSVYLSMQFAKEYIYIYIYIYKYN